MARGNVGISRSVRDFQVLWKPFCGFHRTSFPQPFSRRDDGERAFTGDAVPLPASRSSFLAPPPRSVCIGRVIGGVPRPMVGDVSAPTAPALVRVAMIEVTLAAASVVTDRCENSGRRTRATRRDAPGDRW